MISFFSQARQALGFQLDLNKTEQTFVQSPALLGGAGVFCGGGGGQGGRGGPLLLLPLPVSAQSPHLSLSPTLGYF